MIVNYEKDFRFAKTNCKVFYLDFRRMCMLGIGPLKNSTECSNFKKKNYNKNISNNRLENIFYKGFLVDSFIY